MLIIKSGITKAPKLKGVSLVSACGLSLCFSSKENLTRVDSFIEYRASDISKIYLNKPEAYFHNYDLYDFAKHLATLLNKGVHIELSVHTDLKYDRAKLDLREFLWNLMQEEEDPRLLNMKNDDSLRFQPWQPILKETHSQIIYNQEFPWFSEFLETQHTRIVEEDSRNLDTKGVYLTHLNGKQDIETLTTSKVLARRETKGTSNFFGVSDNATQVKVYLEKALEVYFTSNSVSGGTLYWLGKQLAHTLDYCGVSTKFGYVLLLSPIWNNHDVSNYGGFRWSKWGSYIGKYERQSDYLGHETGLDFVFIWNLIPVVTN